MSLRDDEARLVDAYVRRYFGVEPRDGTAPVGTDDRAVDDDGAAEFAAYLRHHFDSSAA